MASSNRHWPSLFKSKPHQQWQHPDLVINHRSSSSVVSGCEERSPDPKPRWNPKPEQIRILEAIFNSGMVNPPRDEIRKIRGQLQEYGQVGDANVFYWFQNRKSRSKHKQLRHRATTVAPSYSSSSSSEKSPPKSSDNPLSAHGSMPIVELVSSSPTGSVNQRYSFQEPTTFFFPPPPPPPPPTPAVSFFLPEITNLPHIPDHHQDSEAETTCSNNDFLLNELLIMNHGPLIKLEGVNDEDDQKMKKPQMQLQQHMSYTVSSPTNPIKGGTEGSAVGPAKSTVFINDIAFEAPVGPFSVKEAFGDNAVMLHPSGQPVPTNECGLTVQSLQHGAFYYLIWKN